AEGQRLRRDLRQLDDQLMEVGSQISSVIASIKKGKMDGLAEDLQFEADALGRRRQELQRERERLALQAARWRRINPEPALIARALERFDELVLRLPPSKRKELVQHLVERIEIRCVDGNMEIAGLSRRQFSMHVWCTLPPVLSTQTADPLFGATYSPSSSRWQISAQFEIKRVGKAHVASLRKPF